MILADDMGWGDWSRTGAPVPTPELEAMSRSPHAAWFHRAYAGNPICSPTRASLLTGRTPARGCIHDVEQHIERVVFYISEHADGERRACADLRVT